MKKCIWCLKRETEVPFEKEAHTIPKSLGGKNICENVCDDCNSYFGNFQNGQPAIEVVLKEALNISKHILLNQIKEKPKKQFTSEYFNVNFKVGTIKSKPRYSFARYRQEILGRLLTRGIYKIFLEERERQCNDAFDERFNFIRQFSRYNIGDYLVYVKKPKFDGLVAFASVDIHEPQIRFNEYSDDIDKEYRLYTYPLMGHYFVIPTSIISDITIAKFIEKLRIENNPFGEELIPIQYFENIDYLFTTLK